jgi:hypothetical protein
LAIGFQGKKINTTKFVMALGGRQSTTARNNQPNLRWIDGGVIGEDARLSGNTGGAVFDRSGVIELGGGRI